MVRLPFLVFGICPLKNVSVCGVATHVVVMYIWGSGQVNDMRSIYTSSGHWADAWG